MEPTTPTRPTPAAEPARNELVDAPGLEAFFLGDDERPSQARPETSAATDPLREMLLFALGAEWFALPVPTLREIVMPPPLSEVPRARPAVMGVTMLRGEVVPVIDPRARLGLPARQPSGSLTRVVIVDAGQGPLGLWVDRVIQVVRVRASALEDPPPGVATEGDAVVRIGRQGERIYGVLDLGQLLLNEVSSP